PPPTCFEFEGSTKKRPGSFLPGLRFPHRGQVPVPASVTERRPPPPPFTLRVADLAPFVVGLNFTLIVQVAWPASDSPQLFVEANCPALAPVSAMLVMVTALALVLVTVTALGALIVLIGWLPKARERGFSVSTVPCSTYRPFTPVRLSVPSATTSPAALMKSPLVKVTYGLRGSAESMSAFKSWIFPPSFLHRKACTLASPAR